MHGLKGTITCKYFADFASFDTISKFTFKRMMPKVSNIIAVSRLRDTAVFELEPFWRVFLNKNHDKIN